MTDPRRNPRKSEGVAVKRFLFILTLVLCGVLLCSCMSHIEDTNGEDDSSLCSLTDKDIIDGTSTLKQGSVSSKRNDRGEMKVNKFSGVETVDSINVRDAAETVTFTATVESGNFRAVIVKDGEIFAELKTDGEKDSITLTEPGKYELKIAGESASFEIEYKIK